MNGNPTPTPADISTGAPRIYFTVLLEVFGEEYEVEVFWLNEERWNAMSASEQRNFLAGNEEQIRDHMNIYTQEISR